MGIIQSVYCKVLCYIHSIFIISMVYWKYYNYYYGKYLFIWFVLYAKWHVEMTYVCTIGFAYRLASFSETTSRL